MKYKVLLIMLACKGVLFADLYLQQVISFSIAPATEMLLLGPAPLFHLEGKEKSQQIEVAYAIHTNEKNKKISAYLDAEMPQGTSLFVRLAPPRGARSLEDQELSTTPTDLLLELSTVSQSGLPILYTFSASDEAEKMPNLSRIITYTITDG